MARSFSEKRRIRKSFGRVSEVAPMPNLIEVQKSSYDHFLQMGVVPEQRTSVDGVWAAGEATGIGGAFARAIASRSAIACSHASS